MTFQPGLPLLARTTAVILCIYLANSFPVCYTTHVVLDNHRLLSTFTRSTSSLSIVKARRTTRLNNWLGDLWEEVIEFSTYGPSERALLKAKRKAASEQNDSLSLAAFRDAKERSNKRSIRIVENDSSLSVQAFQKAVVATKSKIEDDRIELPDGIDGYYLRDLIVSRWGVPLDVDFQRGMGNSVYCTVLPVVGFGNPTKSRHDSELDYLMHLQAVLEVLQQYSADSNNLERFLLFVETTSRVPKPGIESLPYRMDLSDGELLRIRGTS